MQKKTKIKIKIMELNLVEKKNRRGCRHLLPSQ